MADLAQPGQGLEFRLIAGIFIQPRCSPYRETICSYPGETAIIQGDNLPV